MKTLEQELKQVENEMESAQERRNNLYELYVGGFDILALENRIETLTEQRNKILNEMYGE
jgi:hypothetical protein